MIQALSLIGIQKNPDSRWYWSLRPRFFKIVGITFLAIFLILLGLAKYSESPRFCNSCHIMDPYYKAWKSSKHNFVACVECHYPPGSPKTILWKKFQALSQVAKYVTRTYSSKPFAEIEDASCLRSGCHSTRLLDGKVTTSSGIKFDHRPHLSEARRGRKLRCVSCHSQIVVGRHVEVTYDTCYLCHFKGYSEGRQLKPLGGCLGCHDIPSKTFRIGNISYNHKDFVTKRGIPCQNCHMDVIQGEGHAPKDRCFTCHNQPEKLAKYADIAHLHEKHVTDRNVACFHCHQEMQHGFTEDEKVIPHVGAEPQSPSKEASHLREPTLMFNCAMCHEDKHTGQLEMYSGKVKSLGLPEMPSPMYLAHVDCAGCHYEEERDSAKAEFSGKTFKASRRACVKCHGAHFNGIWEETSVALHDTLSRLQDKIKAAKTALAIANVPDQSKKKLRRSLDKVDRWQYFLKESHGEHNIYLASLTMRKEDAILGEIGSSLNAQLPDLSTLPLISGAYCATMCHPKVGAKVPPEHVRAFGKTMPHQQHTEMLSCTQCHEIGTHKSVPLRKDAKTLCQSCHPS